MTSTLPKMTSTEPVHAAPLAAQLAEFQAAHRARVAPQRVATMEAATMALRASGIEDRALKVGHTVPALTLPDALGRPVDLQALWSRGPLVMVFYRGGWCPYCNLQLRAWQQRLAALRHRGASLVAISPQTPDGSLGTAEKNELAFPVLSDSALEAASAFGIGYTMAPELVELYASIGHDLPEINGNGQWVLPIPATYVIDRTGRAAYAHVEADYRRRAEPDEVLVVVSLLQDAALI